MEYPGNSALSDDIKQRIVATFRQTLDSAKGGNHKEALLGCDFILKLDPEFQPAKTLMSRLQGASAPGGAGPAAAPAPPPPARPAPPSPPGGSLAGSSAAELGQQLQGLLSERRFQAAMKLAQAHLGVVSAHPELQALAQEAQSKLEGEPYVVNFLDSAAKALQQGQREEAEKLLGKAKALDPGHPRLADLESQAASAGPAASAEADPLAAFGTESDPLAAFGAAEPPPPPAEAGAESEAPAEIDDDPFAALSETPSLVETPPLVGGPEGDDPFADLDAGLSFEGTDFESTDDASDEIDDDPFSLLSESETPGDLDPGAAIPPGATTAGAEASGDDRVQQLLAEGQAAFEQGDHQGAIDAWSRIFLIDLDNAEASRRIEEARKLKAESERQAEEVYHEGLTAWQAGDTEAASAAFEKVLQVQPDHALAREHLEQIAGGKGPEAVEVPPPPPPSPAGGGVPQATDEELLEEILVPPDPGEFPEGFESLGDEPKRKTAAAGPRVSRKFLAIGLGVLLLVLAGGAYLFMNRASIFPNSEPEQGARGAGVNAPVNPLEQARKLHAGGKTKIAISQLSRLPEQSPFFEEAQELIAQWSRPEPEPEPEEPAIPAANAEQRLELVADAERLLAEGEHLRARDKLTAAADLAPLRGEESQMLSAAEQALQPLQSEIQAIRVRDWDFALKSLWRKHTAEPENRDVVRLMVNCYYNLALRDLQRGDQRAAVESFDEAISLAPDDEEVVRHRQFAQTYLSRPPDLLYRIYVKYLPYR